MESWQVALSTGCFYKKSIFDVLEPIKNSGFAAVEVCSSPGHLDYHDPGKVRKVQSLLSELGLEAMSFHAPFAEGIDITSPDRGERERSAEEIMKAAEAAEILRVKNFVIHPGPEKNQAPPAEEFLKRMNNSAEFVQELATRCQKCGMRLLLENMIPSLLFGHIRDLVWIIASVSSLNVGICLDTGHASIGSPLGNIPKKISGYLDMLHVNDNRGEEDEHLPPGEGNVDWGQLVRDLEATGFSGGMVLELSGDRGFTMEQVLAQAVDSRKFLKDLQRG